MVSMRHTAYLTFKIHQFLHVFCEASPNKIVPFEPLKLIFCKNEIIKISLSFIGSLPRFIRDKFSLHLKFTKFEGVKK